MYCQQNNYTEILNIFLSAYIGKRGKLFTVLIQETMHRFKLSFSFQAPL